MIKITSRGSFKKTESFLDRMSRGEILSVLESNAQAGVEALRAATPIDSGATAAAWGYEVDKVGGNYRITWTNSNIVNGAPLAVMLQYGHGTGTGGFVQGRDYINPAIQPVFDRIAENVWKAVTSA
jgi:nanoRNase/pAp phosphatase (c-di-AMP/oligoRNAs hydrolase)